MRSMCGVQLTDREITTDLSVGLNGTMEQLAMANSINWYGHVLMREDGHVLRREDGHVLRWAIDFEAEGQKKKGRPKRTWKKQIEEERVKMHFAD